MTDFGSRRPACAGPSAAEDGSRSGWSRWRPEADRSGAELDWIGRELGRSYDSVLEEPLPRRFADLLSQLEARERRAGGGR